MIASRWPLITLILTVSAAAGWFAGPSLKSGTHGAQDSSQRATATAEPAPALTLPDTSTGLGGYSGRQLHLLARSWRERLMASNPARLETELMERILGGLHSPADFAAFGRFLRELKDQEPLAPHLSAVFHEWSRMDPGAAAEAALWIDLNSNYSRKLTLESVYNNWAAHDCAAALAHAEQSSDKNAREAGRQAALKVTARTDAAAGMALALRSPAPAGTASDPAAKLLFEWFNSDSGNALAWMETQTDPLVLERVLGTFAGSAYSHHSPEGALRAAMAIPPGQMQDHLIQHSMVSWGAAITQGKKEAEPLLEALKALPPAQRTTATQNAVYALPPKALAAFGDWEDLAANEDERHHLSRLNVLSLVRQDRFEDAAAKLTSLPEKVLRRGDGAELWSDVFSHWWLKTPDAATAWFRDLPYQEKQPAFVWIADNLLRRKALTHQGVAELALKLNSPETVDTAVRLWSSSDAAAAAAWAGANVQK